MVEENEAGETTAAEGSATVAKAVSQPPQNAAFVFSHLCYSTSKCTFKLCANIRLPPCRTWPPLRRKAKISRACANCLADVGPEYKRSSATTAFSSTGISITSAGWLGPR